MNKVIFISILFAVAQNKICAQDNDAGEEEALTQIFKPASSKPTFKNCGDNKICVPFFNCVSDTGQMNTDGVNLVSIRMDSSRPCPQFLETCCALSSKSTSSVSIKTPPNKGPHEIKNSCGLKQQDTLFKLQDAIDESEYLEFTWMIAVLERESPNEALSFVCGGSLIHPKVVLTAAHCIVKKSEQKLILRAGEWDPSTTNEQYEHQDLGVIEKIVHELYSKAGGLNDIAILIADGEFKLGDNVMPICLPPPNALFDDKTDCIATGWGKDQWSKVDAYQSILKKVTLPMVSHEMCLSQLRESKLGPRFRLHESFVCAGGKTKGQNGADTCKGDGGGPLFCPVHGEKNRFYQVGITSWGLGCTGEYPGLYAAVSRFRNWIDIVMISRTFDKEYYEFSS